MKTALGQDRQDFVLRGKRLEYFTIAWNSIEAFVAMFAGASAGSIALLGFGLDSLIEVTSGSAVLWRLHLDNPKRRERAERISLKIVGACFLALAVYIIVDSAMSLLSHEAPAHSVMGIVLMVASLIVMPLLSRAKRKVSRALGSAAMNADATQAAICSYLSAIVLAGLLANYLVGWWWADSTAALVMVPLISWEGIEAIRGHTCAHCE